MTNIGNIVGFNYRLTEMAAAMAAEQLKKLDALNDIRVGYVEYLNRSLSKYDFIKTPPPCPHGPGCPDCQSTYYVYPLRFLPEVLGCSRTDFLKVINAEGLRFYQGYVKPLYLQPIYQRKGLHSSMVIPLPPRKIKALRRTITWEPAPTPKNYTLNRC